MGNIFKFVFNSSELSDDKTLFLGVSIDTVFTVFTTILIFIAGYIVNRKIERNKENKRLNELEEYFIKLVELLEKPLMKQKDALVDLTKKLKQRVEQHYFVADVTGFRVDLIKEIDNKDLYTIFIKRKKGKVEIKTELFQKIRGYIDYLDEVKKSIKSSFEEMKLKSEKYDATYKENLKITGDAFDSMLAQNVQRGIRPDQDTFLQELDRIRATWIQSGTEEVPFQDRYLAREHYLEPVQQLCRTRIADPRAAFILQHTLECLYALDNIEEVKYVYRRHFLLDARGMQKALIEIRGSLNEFALM